MIQIKTYNFRQAIEKIVYTLMILLILFLVLFFSLIVGYFLKREFEESIVKTKSESLEEVFTKSLYVNKILEEELSIFKNKNNSINQEEITENLNQDSIEFEFEEIPKVKYDMPSRYETKIDEAGKIEIGNTKISNYSNLELDFEELSKPLEININSNTDFLIYHTHATECYTLENQETENYRTTNSEYNMIMIGKTLKKELEKREFSSLHDTILHDYPNYNGSYAHSLETITKYMKTKKFDFVLDIHRDAISSDLTYGPVCEIEGERTAQLMFVVGTNASGLKHDEWMKNLKLALMIQNRANEMYPGLFRDLNLSKSRYNQHVSNGALIIEVGTTGNTLEEAKNSMKYLANVIESFK